MEDSQGSKPDLRNSAVRDYRGASGNVARVELCTHLAYRKGEDGNPPPVHRRARALSQQLHPKFLSLTGTRCYHPPCESIVAKCCQCIDMGRSPAPQLDVR